MAKGDKNLVLGAARRALERAGVNGDDLGERLAWLERRADHAIGQVIEYALSAPTRDDSMRASEMLDEADRLLGRAIALARSGARAAGFGEEE